MRNPTSKASDTTTDQEASDTVTTTDTAPEASDTVTTTDTAPEASSEASDTATDQQASDTAEPLTHEQRVAAWLAIDTAGTGHLSLVDQQAVYGATRKAKDREAVVALLGKAISDALAATDYAKAGAASALLNLVNASDAPVDPVGEALHALLTYSYASASLLASLDEGTRAKVTSALAESLAANPVAPEGFEPSPGFAPCGSKASKGTRKASSKASGTSDKPRAGKGWVSAFVSRVIPADGSAMLLSEMEKADAGMLLAGLPYRPSLGAITACVKGPNPPAGVSVTTVRNGDKDQLAAKVSDASAFVVADIPADPHGASDTAPEASSEASK